jgi:ATP-binding cassette, subfamily B, bacterial MsbA
MLKQNGLDLYKRLLNYALPYKWRIILSVVASLGVAGSDAAIAKLVQPFVDRLIVAGERQMILLVPMMVIGIALFKGVSRFIQEYYIRTSGQLVVQAIRNQLFDHTIGLSMRFFTRTSTGNLMSRVLNDIGIMQTSVADVLVGIMRDGVSMLALIGVAFYTDWQMALIAFVVIPVTGLPASIIGRKIKNYSRRGQAALGTLTTVLEQAFSGIKVIKAFGAEAREQEKFHQENLGYYNFIRKVLKYVAFSAPVIELLAAFGAAGVLWLGLERVMKGEMTQGELFSVLTAVLMLYTPVKRLTRVHNQIQMAMGAAERVFEILDESPDVVDAEQPKRLDRVAGEVEFRDVCFAYENDLVLQDFSVSAAPGEVVALVGPSGAGKSTIAGLLMRFFDPVAGQILIDGIDIREISQTDLHRNMALVDQETFLFSGSVRDNIRYGRAAATDKEIEEVARLAYAEEFITELPEGFATEIGDRGLRLSGGQRQRICIARAFLRNAPILILDEATSALDTESESMVQRALGNLMTSRTTFVIAHRLSTIMNADKIVVLNDGRMVEQGSHSELLEKSGLYRRLHDMQFRDA